MPNQSIGIKIFLGIALGIILVGLFNLGVSTFYPGPEYNDYCAEFRVPCAVGGGDCEIEHDGSCYEGYDLARDNYNNNIFYVFLIAGLVLAVVGLFIINLSFQILFLGSGVVLMLEGILRNLNNKIPAFIAGVIVFAILSYFVWRQVKD